MFDNQKIVFCFLFLKKKKNMVSLGKKNNGFHLVLLEND